MNRYIGVDKLIDDIRPFAEYDSNRSNKDWVRRFEIAINAQPTADVRENVRGEWIDCEVVHDRKDAKITDWQQARCSICGKWHTTPYMYNWDHFEYCPNCGAQMIERTG